jgi:hypothetical protein
MKCAIAVIISLMAVPIPAGPQQSSSQPVVVELFTSEGCSDCPPADDLLSAMVQRPDPNLKVIPLAFHVTYWNRQGWRDRFSDDRYTERQQEYERQFHLRSAYTPQSVIDGQYQTVGSDAHQIIEFIRRAAAEPKPVTVEVSANGDSVNIVARAPNDNVSGKVLLAITEDGLSTEVKAGENRSRTLKHSAVVRSLEEIGRLKNGAFSRVVRLKLGNDWQREKMHVVVLIEDKSDHVLGAGTAPL